MIQLHRLEGFYWVARTGGYTRAARAFPYPLTQPAVYQQVRKLQDDLGVALVERVGRDRVLLTPAGKALYDFAAPFFEQLPDVARSLQKGELGGRLRVQTTSHLLRHLMPSWIRRLLGKCPNIQIELFEGGDADPTKLVRGEVDLLVDHLPSIPGDIETRVVGMVRGFIAIPKSHKVAKKPNVSIKELAGTPFVAYTPNRMHRGLQMRALEHHALTPPQFYSASTSESILGIVAAGLGFSLIPSLLPRGPQHPGVVARLMTDPRAEFPIYAAYRASSAQQPVLQAALLHAPGCLANREQSTR